MAKVARNARSAARVSTRRSQAGSAPRPVSPNGVKWQAPRPLVTPPEGQDSSRQIKKITSAKTNGNRPQEGTALYERLPATPSHPPAAHENHAETSSARSMPSSSPSRAAAWQNFQCRSRPGCR